MKNILLSICIALLALPAQAETVKIVADNWCPYNCEPAAEHPGFMIEIAKRAFAKHNISVDYSTMPWSRAIEETRAGKHTAIVGSSYEDAPDFVFPSLPLGKMVNAFYVKKGNPWRYTGPESLMSISLGVIADYTYNKDLDAHIAKQGKNMKYIQTVSGDNALEMNVKKLLAGRIGALVEGRYVMAYHLAKNGGADAIEEAGALPPSKADDLFIAFSPKEPKAKQYSEILATELQAMRKSGELKQILTAYNLEDWKK